jgi:hypothetical protein
MEKRDKVLLISGAVAALIAAAIYLIKARIAAGFAAGYATGLVNYFLIVSQVKKLIGPPGNTTGKVMTGLFLYFLRLLGAAAVIFFVAVNAKYFSIAGFLAGFTVCVTVIIVAHKIYGIKN